MTFGGYSYPNWVMDLIIAVDEYEDLHEHVKEGGHCLHDALESVPKDVLFAARAVAEYTRDAQPAKVVYRLKGKNYNDPTEVIHRQARYAGSSLGVVDGESAIIQEFEINNEGREQNDG